MPRDVTEFLTTDESSPQCYGDSGCMLGALRDYPMVLRDEHYRQELRHSIYLFARAPESGAQVFIHVFPLPNGRAEYEKTLGFYNEQRKNFRLPSGQTFSDLTLAPASSEGFDEHLVFRTKDGRYRRRIVHGFVGAHRAVMLVFSLNHTDFLGSQFFAQVCGHLKLADLPFDGFGVTGGCRVDPGEPHGK